MRYLHLVLRNLTRSKRRTVLTVASITVSLFLITLLMTAFAAMRVSPESDTAHLRLVTRHKVSLTNVLPESYWEKMRRIPGVVAVCPSSWFGGIYIDERNFMAQFAVDARSLIRMTQGEKSFRADPEQAKAWVEDRQGALVHEDLAQKYGWKVGDTFTIKGTIYPFDPELKVRGIWSGDDAAVYFHREYLEEGIGRPGIVGFFWIKVDKAENLTRIAKAVDALFANSDAETLTETQSAFQAGFLEMLGDVQGLVTKLSAVIAATILMVAANTMSMSIRERTTEIAVLKALGFPPARVLVLLLSESTLIAGLGGFFGVVGFWGLAYYIFNVLKFRMPMLWFTLVPPPWLVGALMAGSLALGLASGLVPSIGAARKPIVEGLRQA